MRSNHKINPAFILLLFFFCSCAGSYTETTWTSPNKATEKIRNVLILGLTENYENRQIVETEVSYMLLEQGVRARKSFDILKEVNRENALRVMDSLGFNGILTMQVKSVDYQNSRDPRTTNLIDPNYTYLNYYFDTYQGSEYQRRIVRIESRLYERQTGNIIYLAESTTFDVQDIEVFIHDFSKSIVKGLTKGKKVVKTIEEDS
jgi:hypothetical protein